jgi:signal recognition particle subunit SEC65
LTDAEKPKVKAVLEDSSKKMKEIMSDTSLDQAARREKMQPIRDEQNKQMKAILTDDQYTKYLAMNQRGGKKKKAE